MMNEGSNENSISNGVFWKLLERFGAQGVTLGVSIVLARILDTEVYGSIALVTVFLTIMQVFIDAGLGNALIQKKDSDDLDFSSVFIFNVIICSLLYALLFAAAPSIASFYNNLDLIPVIRVLGLTLVISGVKNIQQAYVAKNMIFRKFFFSTLGGTVCAAFIGILLALNGYGIWALVIQSLANNFIDTLILWIVVEWKPKFMFSWKRLTGLLGYGWKLLISALMEVGYQNIRQLIIGKIYNSSDLAFYNRGEQLPAILISNINSSIDSVLFPAMSNCQNDLQKVKSITQRALKISTYITMPIMMGIAVCAEPLIIIILTEKWIPCIFFLRVFCFTYAFYPVHTANLNAIKAVGRSDIFLKLEIVKKIVGIIIVLITYKISVEAMTLSLIFMSIIGQIINAWPNKKLIGYGYLEQLKDILPNLLITMLMGMIVFTFGFWGWSYLITLIVQVLTGVITFVLLSYVFRIEGFVFLFDAIKKKLAW